MSSTMATPAAATTRVSYKRLDSSKHEIRLLELQPAHDIKERVVCRLVNVTLTSHPEFIGLSVLYGDPKCTEQILLNGGRVTVPTNLGQALRNVRAVFLDSVSAKSENHTPRHPPPAAEKAPRWLLHLMRGFRSILSESSGSGSNQVPLRLWVDALCVNQFDEREQAERRTRMAVIYKSARMVIGWLGEKDETSDLSVEIIRAVDKAMPLNFGDQGDRIQHPENYAPQYKWMAEISWLWDVPADMSKPTESPSFIAIHNFLSRPYLQRDWILEELAMARFPAFLLGDEVVSWMQVLRLIRNNEELIDNGASLFPEEYRSMIHFLPLGSIYTLLKDFEHRQKAKASKAGRSVATSLSSVSTSNH